MKTAVVEIKCSYNGKVIICISFIKQVFIRLPKFR